MRSYVSHSGSAIAFISGAVVLFASLTGCEHEEIRAAVVRPVLSTIAAPHSGPTDGYSGTIEPRYQTDLGFRTLGRIVARDVNVGDSVKVGQRLAALDPEVFEIAIRSQEATLSNVRAQKENAEANLKRQTILLSQNVTPQAEFDMAKKTNEAAVAAVAQAQADLDKAREQLGYTELLADMDGVVTRISAETGQTVNAGQTIVSIASPDLREAVVDLGEDVVAALAIGAEFTVALQISGTVETTGQVREIAPQADATTRTRRVKIALPSPPDSFRLGATVTAFSTVALQTNIRLPKSALLDTDGSTFVWVVDQENKKVNRTSVVVLNRSDRDIEIASGIKPGDRVVTAGVHSLTDGQPIRWNRGDM